MNTFCEFLLEKNQVSMQMFFFSQVGLVGQLSLKS